MSAEYEIDNYGHIYKNGERIGYIRNFSGEHIPTAREIARAMILEQEKLTEERKREKAENDYWNMIYKSCAEHNLPVPRRYPRMHDDL